MGPLKTETNDVDINDSFNLQSVKVELADLCEFEGLFDADIEPMTVVKFELTIYSVLECFHHTLCFYRDRNILNTMTHHLRTAVLTFREWFAMWSTVLNIPVEQITVPYYEYVEVTPENIKRMVSNIGDHITDLTQKAKNDGLSSVRKINRQNRMFRFRLGVLCENIRAASTRSADEDHPGPEVPIPSKIGQCLLESMIFNMFPSTAEMRALHIYLFQQEQ